MSRQKGEETKDQHIVDLGEVRAQKLEEKRRHAERIFFKHLLSVYCITDSSQMRPIELVDISETGISFQVPHNANDPWPTSESNLVVRLYFSQDTYLPLHLKIENSRPSIVDGDRFVRYGCSVDKTLTTFETFQQFVRFMKLYSEHAHKDMGDVTVFYI
jgi:hypothetical protein